MANFPARPSTSRAVLKPASEAILSILGYRVVFSVQAARTARKVPLAQSLYTCTVDCSISCMCGVVWKGAISDIPARYVPIVHSTAGIACRVSTQATITA